MSLRLILTRHAKSSWNNALLTDHDRVLNERGRLAASAIGDWLAAKGYVPDQVLCSSAERTQETWELIAAKIAHAPMPDILRMLYLASEDQMLGALHKAKGVTVMMVTHNPGTAYLAEGLAQTAPDIGAFSRYPTAATTVFDFDTDSWNKISWNSGKVIDFITPRDLAP